MKYHEFFKREYEKLFPILSLWLSPIFILLAVLKDISLVGFRADWLLIRMAYIPAMYINILLYRRAKFFNRHYEISSWASATYVSLFATYFSFSTGYFKSTYLLAVISIIGALSAMPLSRFSFYGIVLFSLSIFIGGNAYMIGGNLHEISTSILPYLPIASFFIAIYELFLFKRKKEYRIQEKLNFHLAQQDEMIIRQSKTLADSQIDIQVGRIAAQVAHDVQSPLDALIVSLDELKGTEDAVQRAKCSVARIKAIAESLLQSRAEYQSQELVNADIVPLIKQVIEEKKTLCALTQKSIKMNFQENVQSIFCPINPLDFTRVLSNIIQNSIEAIETEGNISLSLEQRLAGVILIVEDDGKGIPTDILPRVFERGFSHLKERGTGLGLSHAKEVLSAWKGKIEIGPRKLGGTKVTLILPSTISKSPEGFDKVEYVLLDDSELTHASWKASANKHQVELLAFFAPTQLLEKIHQIPKCANIYVDYNLGNGQNGVEIASNLKANGFLNVFLATGMRNLEIQNIENIIPVVSKEPPWRGQNLN